MIYPEEDEYQPVGNESRDFPFNFTHLKARSPTLPLHFDRRYLPRDLCEKELLSVTECLLLYNVNQEQLQKMCTLESSKFESCRRRRDMRILSGIYKWETQHWTNLDIQNRGMYLMGLGRKLSRLEEDFKRQTSTISGLSRSQLIQGEIKELRWRIQYLNKLKATVQS